MNNLDDQNKIRKLDKENVYGSVIELGKQCVHAYTETENIRVPEEYKKVNKVLMSGMGGSGLGARIIESVYASNLKIPFVRLNDYDLPFWVDEDTLVICSSFSGTTEETVQNAKQAITKRAKWMAIGSGGELIELAKRENVPYYRIIPTYNPSKQPRMAIGYQVIGQLKFAASVNLISLTNGDVSQSVSAMNKVLDSSRVEVATADNPAKQTAEKFFQKKIVFIAARHLVGAAHTVKNQMNENSKNFSAIYEIPELNHHLLEGLTYPDANKQDLMVLLLNSGNYPARIQQRFTITEDVMKKNRLQTVVWSGNEKDLLAEAFAYIQFGGLVNFYLSMLYNINPAPIPWVDYFKTQLGQSLGQWK